MSNYKSIEQESIDRQIEEAFSVYLVEGWYYLHDLEKIVDEARAGKRALIESKPKRRDEEND